MKGLISILSKRQNWNLVDVRIKHHRNWTSSGLIEFLSTVLFLMPFQNFSFVFKAVTIFSKAKLQTEETILTSSLR